MAIIDIFLKRQKRNRGEVSDVFTYNELPAPLRTQVVFLMREAYAVETFSESYEYIATAFWSVLNQLRKELGVFRLNNSNATAFSEIVDFILNERDIEKVLSAIELVFRMMDEKLRHTPFYLNNLGAPVDEVISELNLRFRERGIGYEYACGQIIKIDSKLIHSEVMKPALSLLHAPLFKGANEEFLSAHKHYREGRLEECLVDCCKALESTLKVICTKRGWKYQPTDSVKKLLDVVFKNRLVPSFSESHFSTLRSTLESGLPPLRNKMGGHGQGAEIRETPESIGAYALHLTATNIVFLVNSEADL